MNDFTCCVLLITKNYDTEVLLFLETHDDFACGF